MFRPYFVDLDLAVKPVKDSASQFLCDSRAYECEHVFVFCASNCRAENMDVHER